jgi:cell division protein FtsX
MSFEGTIRGGIVVLDETPNPLPEGTRVEVTEQPKAKTIADVLKNVIGKAEGLPEDAARQVDHYLYGAPKR